MEGNTVHILGKGNVVIYEAPLIGFASASDDIFARFREKDVIGPQFFGPREWLPAAKTVAAFFLPFTPEVRLSNRADRTDPSVEWLYARIEGQEFIGSYMTALRQLLQSQGIETCVPAMDERFCLSFEIVSTESGGDIHVDSRWSERHAAYACGLGTFGLSRGLISQKGMAGRYASLILSAEWDPSERRYTGVYDYCVECGACMRNCPAGAITLTAGKNNLICKTFTDQMKAKYAPRYGCGKCQVGVPCESRALGLREGTRAAG